MFYSVELLTKKGPLGKIWLAATLNNLNKRDVLQSDIGVLCEGVTNPLVNLSVRLSSILLYGILIIYSRQVGYLLEDAQEV